jgi:hypothetical protein
MKKWIALVVSFVLAMAMLTGCGSSNNTSGESGSADKPAGGVADTSKPVDLEIIESGFTVGESGYVHYGIAVNNPNTGFLVDSYVVTVTGKDADGKIVFTDEQTMGTLVPGDTQIFATQAGNGTAPATVEISVSAKERNWQATDKKAVKYFEITNTNVVPSDYGLGASFTGEIVLLEKLPENSFMESAWLSVIFRDANGAIISGDHSFVDNLAVGQALPFELHIYNVPDYASYELHALPW